MSGKNIIITYHLHPTIRSCQTQFKLPSKTNYSENSAQNVKKSKDDQSYLRPGIRSFDIYIWDILHQITVINNSNFENGLT